MKKQNGEVIEKWIRIKFDYVPKYCTSYMIQEHDELHDMWNTQIFIQRRKTTNRKWKKTQNKRGMKYQVIGTKTKGGQEQGD